MKVGIVGTGAMGSGIAQVAAQSGEEVILFDTNVSSIEKSKENLKNNVQKLLEKNKISSEQKDEILKNHHYVDNIDQLSSCDIIIEAIIEDLEIKKQLFTALEKVVSHTCILATNTSSLSIASISSALTNKDRFIGIHFFNPATILPLVEIIPSICTSENTTQQSLKIIEKWNKLPVLAKDTPGFIVNKVARPYYGEALRIYEEGIADFSTIDWAMKEIGGFKMGPFELMDFIGNDINFKVTETVFYSFYNDPKYKPALTQKRLFEAGLLGRKTGRGYYQYNTNQNILEPIKNIELGHQIFNRILAMLINEAYDTLFWKIATKEHIDLAVKKGVNYPKGLFEWANEIGIKKIHSQLLNLYNTYNEDRYRPCPLIVKEA